MADNSAIEWTEATLNAWTGCRKRSAGCANCYITRQPPLRIAGRKWVKGATLAPDGSGPVVYHLERIAKMVSRKKPTLYFVNSLSDVFLEDVPDDVIALLFAGMACAPQHTFQVLTKRPERMHELLTSDDWWRHVWEATVKHWPREARGQEAPALRIDGFWQLTNVWIGVTVENRAQVARADLLRATPAAVRFLSCEPMLGPVVPHLDSRDSGWGAMWWEWAGTDVEGERVLVLENRDELPSLDLKGIDWVIAGGESGPGARPCREEWLRDLRDACQRESHRLGTGTGWQVGELPGQEPPLPEQRPCRFFLKQLGGHPDKRGGDKALLDGRVWHEMPPVGEPVVA